MAWRPSGTKTNNRTFSRSYLYLALLSITPLPLRRLFRNSIGVLRQAQRERGKYLNLRPGNTARGEALERYCDTVSREREVRLQTDEFAHQLAALDQRCAR
jgi:hypothetical protein